MPVINDDMWKNYLCQENPTVLSLLANIHPFIFWQNELLRSTLKNKLMDFFLPQEKERVLTEI